MQKLTLDPPIALKFCEKYLLFVEEMFQIIPTWIFCAWPFLSPEQYPLQVYGHTINSNLTHVIYDVILGGRNVGLQHGVDLKELLWLQRCVINHSDDFSKSERKHLNHSVSK